MEQLKTILGEQIKDLPKDLQNHISSKVWLDSLNTICSPHHLNEDQLYTVQLETLLTLAMLADRSTLKQRLLEEGTISETTATQLTQEIEQKILAPMEDVFQSFEKAMNEEPKPEKEPAPTQTPPQTTSTPAIPTPVTPSKPPTPNFLNDKLTKIVSSPTPLERPAYKGPDPYREIPQ